jgi:hypothetical protein
MVIRSLSTLNLHRTEFVRLLSTARHPVQLPFTHCEYQWAEHEYRDLTGEALFEFPLRISSEEEREQVRSQINSSQIDLSRS